MTIAELTVLISLLTKLGVSPRKTYRLLKQHGVSVEVIAEADVTSALEGVEG